LAREISKLGLGVLNKEVIAKVALEPKFDDFATLPGTFVNWHTLEGSQFTNVSGKWQKREFGPKWSFAIPSIDIPVL
jgi:hypothetical protein